MRLPFIKNNAPHSGSSDSSETDIRDDKRLMWWSPGQLTSPWVPKLWRGGDEYGNPSVCLTLPPFGAFILFYSRRLSHTLVQD